MISNDLIIRRLSKNKIRFITSLILKQADGKCDFLIHIPLPFDPTTGSVKNSVLNETYHHFHYRCMRAFADGGTEITIQTTRKAK